MELIFIIKNDDNTYYQKSTFDNKNLILEDQIKKVTNENFSKNITVSITNIESSLKNVNLLELSKCNSLASLRYILFKKKYVSPKIINKMKVLTDCFIELDNRGKINLSNYNFLEDSLSDENILPIDHEYDSPDTFDQPNFTEKVKKENKLTQTYKTNNYEISKYFIFFGFGIITGYMFKKYIR